MVITCFKTFYEDLLQRQEFYHCEKVLYKASAFISQSQCPYAAMQLQR